MASYMCPAVISTSINNWCTDVHSNKNSCPNNDFKVTIDIKNEFQNWILLKDFTSKQSDVISFTPYPISTSY
jgi:hypothetical protein